MEDMNQDLLVSMMIDMPYEDLVSFRGTSNRIREIHDRNEKYIYKSRIFNRVCIKTYEDVYLLATGKRDYTFLCIKNKMYLPKNSGCVKLGNYPKPNVNYMHKRQDADRQFYEILEYLYLAKKCFEEKSENEWFKEYENLSDISTMFFIASSVGTVSSMIYEQVWYDELENLRGFRDKVTLLEAELSP